MNTAPGSQSQFRRAAAWESCPKRNKIYYFHDWKPLTLLYGDGDLTQFGTTVVHVGDMEDDAASVLEHSHDAVKILCKVDNA